MNNAFIIFFALLGIGCLYAVIFHGATHQLFFFGISTVIVWVLVAEKRREKRIKTKRYQDALNRYSKFK